MNPSPSPYNVDPGPIRFKVEPGQSPFESLLLKLIEIHQESGDVYILSPVNQFVEKIVMVTIAQLEARFAQQHASQDAINRLALAGSLTLAHVVAVAEEANREYPQYDRYFQSADWCLVIFVRQVETKMGVAFKVSDVTLGRQRPFSSSWECWSIRNKCLTIVDPSCFSLDTQLIS